MLKFLNISDFLIGVSSCSETPSKCAITISFFYSMKPSSKFCKIKAYM